MNENVLQTHIWEPLIHTMVVVYVSNIVDYQWTSHDVAEAFSACRLTGSGVVQ